MIMNILFFDENIIVAIKPIGFDSQKEFPLMLKDELGGSIYTVHRLDLNVGGVMVYARNKKMAGYLSRSIQEGTMLKEYLALVHGSLPKEGIYEDLLFKDSRKNKVFVVKRERKGVKKAKLAFDTITSGETSLVHIRLYTGRSHQIRVQFASRGFPLVGDHKYGSHDVASQPMLFSSRLTFPYQGTLRSFEAKPSWA